MSAVNVAYSWPADGTILYAGRNAPTGPSWLPASGQRANVSLNTISDVYMLNAPDTRTRGSGAILSAWCSTVLIPWLGTLGSILVSGGGHGDYLGNEVYRYDIASRVWSRISDPYDIPVSYALGTQADDVPNDGNGTGTGVSETIYGEYWSDDTKSAVVVGQMCPTHTYSHSLCVPPSAAGNANGWFVIVGNFNYQAHKIDLDNPAAGWSRFGPLLNSTGKTERPGYGYSLFDPVRNRIFTSPYINGQQSYAYSLAVPAGTLTTPTQDYMESYYTVGHYGSTDDLYFVMRADKPSVFKVHDPATGIKYSPAMTGTAPADNSGGTVGWIESTRQLCYWPGSGSTVYFLAAPANPRTGTWAWTSQTFPGDTPDGGINTNPLLNRLHYVPALNALMHVGKTTGPVQCWRL